MSSLHQRAKDVFLAALERPAADRAAFLAEACGDDAALRQEVESLLAFHDEQEEGRRDRTRAGLRRRSVRAGRGVRGPLSDDRADRAGRHGRRLARRRPRPRDRGRVEVDRFGRSRRRVSGSSTRFDSRDRSRTRRCAACSTSARPRAGSSSRWSSSAARTSPRCSGASAGCPRRRWSTSPASCAPAWRRRTHKVSFIAISNPPTCSSTMTGCVRITDFGIAIPRTAAGLHMLTGTPGYMAPEQRVLGTVLSEQTDVYALGLVLYELLVGRYAFNRSGEATQPPPPSTLVPNVDPQLERVVMQALSPDPRSSSSLGARGGGEPSGHRGPRVTPGWPLPVLLRAGAPRGGLRARPSQPLWASWPWPRHSSCRLTRAR